MRLITFLIFPILLTNCWKGDHADMIIHNARIYSCDENFTIYEAMAIRDGKIIQMGPEREIMNGYTCDNVIDAEMKPVFPGFHDSHCHFWGFAKSLSEVELKGSGSFNEMIDRIMEYSDKHSGQEWITGRGWDHTLWEGQVFPTNDTLNFLFPDKPVAFRRVDGHAALVNQTALDIAGITPETIVEGGFIGVENGELTGLVLDNAYDLISDQIPELKSEERLKYLKEAEYLMFEQGLTSINDAGIASYERDDYIDWYENGDLKIKDYCMLFPDEDNMRFASENGIYKSGNLHIGSFKVLSDGALGSRGACLVDPYSDRLDEHGFLIQGIKELRAIYEFALEVDYQVGTHCIGDSANRSVLKLYAEIIQDKQDHRWKIEHAQVIHPDDFHYFETIKIIPSVQPTHCTSDMRWAEDRLGNERIKYAYAYKLLLEKAGRIVLGTDFPIEDISPLETFYAAITRMDKKGNPEGGFYPDQVLSREEALRGMTSWAAWANFENHNKGSLEKGKAADFIILTKDIMEIPAADILGIFVYKTFLNGEEVYSAE